MILRYDAFATRLSSLGPLALQASENYVVPRRQVLLVSAGRHKFGELRFVVEGRRAVPGSRQCHGIAHLDVRPPGSELRSAR